MLPIIRKARLLKSFYALLRDPQRTEEIFKISELGRKGYASPSLVAAGNHIYAQPDMQELYERNYRAPQIDLEKLSHSATETFGYAYAKHMITNKLDPNFFPIEETKTPLLYFMMRARESHDMWHVLTGYDTSVVGEIALQAFTLAQTHAPISTLLVAGGLLHALFFRPEMIVAMMEGIVEGYQKGKKAKNLLSFPLETYFDRPLAEVRMKLNLAA